MRRTFLIMIMGIIAIGALGTGVVVSDTPIFSEQAPPINETATETAEPQTEPTPQQYTIVATDPTQINETELAHYGTPGTRVAEKIDMTMRPANVKAVANLSWVVDVRRAVHSQPSEIPGASNGSSLGVEQLHEDGVTGSGVTVGVIDSGFETSNPAITENVAVTQTFRETPGATAHGTSVAEIVTQTAPESELYLVSTATGTDDEQAIQYLTAQDVDIIVYARGYLAVEDDGEHFLTDDITAARNEGTLFVASAGNAAQTHWEGSFRDTDGDLIHEWTADGDEVNSLPAATVAYSGPLDVFIRWDDSNGGESAYRPAFYDLEREEYIKIDRDGVFETGSNRYAALSTTVYSRPVALVVDHIGGPADDEIEVVVGSGPQSIERNVPASSVLVPADTPAAVSVAAYEVGTEQVAPYSSRGPTDDGRQGVAVTGYTNINVENGLYGSTPYVFAGTSAASPYVGGVAALIEQRIDGDASPETLTETLTTSSDNIRQPGPDTVSGAGVVDPVTAIETVSPDTVATDLTVVPATVTANTTTSQNITYTVTNASADGEPDQHRITLPNTTTIEAVQGVTAVDAEGRTIPLNTSGTAQDVNGGLNNQLAFEVTPDTHFNTTEITINATITAGYADQTESTMMPVEVAVTDSSRGDTTATTVITIQPVDSDTAAAYRDADGDVEIQGLRDAISDFTSGEISIVVLRQVIDEFIT